MKFLNNSCMQLGLVACLVSCVTETSSLISTPKTDSEVLEITKAREMKWSFEVKVNGEPFDCSKSYIIGSDQQTVKFKDLRLFISDFALHDQDKTVALDIKESPWQKHGVTLLDFENATGRCLGSPKTHTAIETRVQPGHYNEITFKLGIPFGLNHQIPNIAAPPFNTTDLYKSRREGYYFLKADLSILGKPGIFPLRLSSQECHGQGVPESHVQTYKTQHIIDENPDELPSYCESNNLPEFTFKAQNSFKQHFVIDIGQWLSTLTVKELTPEGCVGSESDSEICAELYRNLGLYFQGKPGNKQNLIKLQTL